jgi:hypothetical protein
MDIAPPLAPFMFAPDETKHPEVRFRLKPLTEPQVAELDSTPGLTESSEASVGMLYRAGCIALDGGRKIEGIKIEGRDAEWPRDRDVIPWDLVFKAGARVYRDAHHTEEQEKNS